MRPILAGLLALALAAPAAPLAAQVDRAGDAVVRQIVVELDERPDRIAMRLAAAMPTGADPVAMGDGSYMLGISGARLPTALARFLSHSLEGAGGPGLPLHRVRTVSLHIGPSEEGTQLRVLLVAPRTEASRQVARAFHERVTGAPIAAGAEILLDGATAGGTGDLVLSRPGDRASTVEAYSASLTAGGHLVTTRSHAGDTLVMGERGGGASLVFVKSDADRPGRSLVVIRSLEEE
ncbi:hypothetical protein DLJ49_00595 [Rhodovulum sp. 12E13]|uniref:hypothetical protein n=1 Tax=Rhodovulum sp. 12E13 TaxID=2203891 RepID=UPI000E11DCAA|nr:hypothetical protein [Rhodovulum sp. 12E13]RDC75287.1 hypothetical protein DLJ49_00595 [Rhodovulum sp. 12E13]